MLRKLKAAERSLSLVLAFGALLVSPVSLDAQRAAAPKAPPAKPAVTKPPDVSALLKTASEAFDHKDLPAAVKALQAVLEAEPKMTAAWFNLAYAYTGLGQKEEAIKAYKKTLELQPDLFEAHLNLGILLMELKRPAEAQPQLAKAVELKPEHTRAHLYYGRALSAGGQPDAAAKEFQEAMRRDPALAIAPFDLGQVLLTRKDFAGALEAFQKASELDPKLSQARLGAALALEGLKRDPEAAAQFEQYLTAQPGDFETRFHLASIDLQQGKNEKALEGLQMVYSADPKMPGVAAALGDVCALLKRLPESEKYYREALAASPGEPDLHRALGQTLLDQQKYPEAEAEFRACLKLDPRNKDAFKGLATSVYLQKRYGEAVPLMEAQAAAPNPPVGLYFVLGSCYDHLRDLPKAIENYERFLALSQNQNPDQEWQAHQRVKLLRRELRK
ncbi:MAG: tetratricopeptide repeat protein [Terriglobia bacterium]